MNPIFLIVPILFAGVIQAQPTAAREKILVDFKASATPDRVAETTDPVLTGIAADRVIIVPAPGSYSVETGAGFLDAAEKKFQFRDRGAFASALLSDGIFLVGKEQGAVFQLDLPPGRYRVTTYHHDVRWASRGRVEVAANGGSVGFVEKASTGKAINGDEVASFSFEADVAKDQPLEISFTMHDDETGGTPSFPVNGVYVEPL